MNIDLKVLQEVAERVVKTPESVDGTADFVATFDPPMVLALLDRLEAAEKALDAIVSWDVGNRRGLPGYQRELLVRWCQIIEATEEP